MVTVGEKTVDERAEVWRFYWECHPYRPPSVAFCGDRLQQARWWWGLTQRELAVRIGTTRVCVTLWENGYTTPETYSVYALSQVLGVSPGWLMGLTDEGGPSEEVVERMRKRLILGEREAKWQDSGSR